MLDTKQIVEILEKELNSTLGSYVIIARSENKDDIIHSYSGDSIELIGLANWFAQYANKVGFDNTHIDLDNIKN